MFFVCLGSLFASLACGDQASPALRIESVAALPEQPHQHDPSVIWFDDFENEALSSAYPEKSGRIDKGAGHGDSLGALRMDYAKGKQGTGGVKIFFGDTPIYPRNALRKQQRFDEIHWRVYVKHQLGWTGGGPAKLSRATSLTSPGWTQSMIAHVWSSGESLTLDPASGIVDGKVVTRRYNDFDRLRWLGNRPASPFKIHSTQESGWWVCVEARVKLNTVGQKDGLFQLWIDGRPQCERQNLDWRGTYDGHGINAVFLEAYWNNGSPVDQSRWLDNFVVSTDPIGPVVCARNPTLIRTDLPTTQGWQVEVANVTANPQVVWRSKTLAATDRVTVDVDNGTFLGTLEGASELAAAETYFGRIRVADGAQPWSTWHQIFRTTGGL